MAASGESIGANSSAALFTADTVLPLGGGLQRLAVLGLVVAIAGLGTLVIFWLDGEQRGWLRRGVLRLPQPFRRLAAAAGD